ncbi:MAG TPA: IclR family transcriptional regulator, partial [Thermoleophilia bacterium]|nr:IclR family transcriptional regulator [Thermoleophilia bacterium]
MEHQLAERKVGVDQAGTDRFTVRALSRGLMVLGLFDEDHPEWDLEGVVGETGIPRLSAQRTVRTMEEAGYLVFNAATNRYRLGPALVVTMYVSESYSDLVRVARPYLEDLVDKTKESVILAVEVDGFPVGADMITGPRPTRRRLAPGRIIDYTASSNGKVFAASKPEAERIRIINNMPTHSTPASIKNPEELERELDQVRIEGVAYDIEERYVGTCGVAAPVYDQVGDLVASIAVVVPAGRFTPEARQFHTEAV